MKKTFNDQVDQMIVLVYASHLHSLLCVGPAQFGGGDLSKGSSIEPLKEHSVMQIDHRGFYEVFSHTVQTARSNNIWFQ